MSAKHTRGPWQVEDAAGEITICAETGTAIDESICFVADGGWNQMPRKTAIANARLIAAAPELLEALQAFVNYVADDHNDTPMLDNDALWEKAESAIAKATGEQP